MAKDSIFRISNCIILLILLVRSPMLQNLQTQNFRKLHQVEQITNFRMSLQYMTFQCFQPFHIFWNTLAQEFFFSGCNFYLHLDQIFALSDTNLILFQYQYAIALLLNCSKDIVQHLYNFSSLIGVSSHLQEEK